MYKLIFAEHFKKQCKSLTKKHPRVIGDIRTALEVFQKETAQYLGAKLYKIRISSSDIRKGKRGGFRVILLVIEIANILVPITIYAKNDRETISEKELEYHLGAIVLELKNNSFIV